MSETNAGLTLEYAPQPAPPRRQWPAKVALSLSVAAMVCLVVSVTMYTAMRGVLRDFQVMLAWTSIWVGGAAIIASIIVMIRNPRGKREIAALAVAVVHAAMVLAVFKYLG